MWLVNALKRREQSDWFWSKYVFQLLYQNEFDSAGGEPFGIVIGDYEISNGCSAGTIYNDIDTIKEVSRTAAAAFSPFICSASANLFGADSFSDLGYYSDLFNQFEQPEYIKWQSFRKMEEARFMGFTLPHVLVRPPYVNDGKRHQDFYFKEQIKIQKQICYGAVQRISLYQQ